MRGWAKSFSYSHLDYYLFGVSLLVGRVSAYSIYMSNGARLYHQMLLSNEEQEVKHDWIFHPPRPCRRSQVANVERATRVSLWNAQQLWIPFAHSFKKHIDIYFCVHIKVERTVPMANTAHRQRKKILSFIDNPLLQRPHQSNQTVLYVSWARIWWIDC